MCACTAEIRTPYCGRGSCQWPSQKPAGARAPRHVDMRVRPASVDDTEACVEMACRFIAEGPYRELVRVDEAHQARLVAYLLEHGGLFVLEVDGVVEGMVGLSLVPLPVSGDLTATEIAWWVAPEHRGGGAGVRLWMAAEAWARAQAAVWIQMIAPHGADDVARMYRKRGYVPLETTWQKRLAA